MTNRNGFRRIGRRGFLIAASGVAGSAISRLAWPQSRCSPAERGDAASCAPRALPAIVLTSAATAAVHPWTTGHVFRKSDVPRGSTITGDAAAVQADVRNRWPDGSAKFAVLSGHAAFERRGPITIALKAGSATPSQPNVQEPTELDAWVGFSGDVNGVYTLQSCLGIDRSTWTLGSWGRVREILGPVMSEFHYYRPTSEPHLAVWFYVRCYSSGSIEIETVIENGWLNVVGPGQKNYRATVSVGGVTKYSGRVQHLHHTRWSRVDWVGIDPQITPKHDAGYLRSTRLVPNYGYTSPSEAAFSGLVTESNPAPFALGNWSAAMGNTGAQPAIGLLPKWEALYCTSTDPRAYAATIGNNRGSGRWPIHYRDDRTGRVPLYSSYPKMSVTTEWGDRPPLPSGDEAGAWDIPHHPSNGYLPYLLEGRWSALESLQFSAFIAIADTNPATRQGKGVLACLNAPLTTRGAAWSWRTMGQAAAASPTALGAAPPAKDDAALQSAFAASIADTASWAKQRYIDGTIDSGAHRNKIGWLGQYDRYTDASYPPSEWWGGSWMVQFQSLALGHVSDLEIENLAAPADLAAMRDHSYDNCLLQLGDESTWNFRRGAVYDRPYLKNGSDPAKPVFMTPAEAFTSYKAARALTPLSADARDTLKAHSANADMTAGDSSNDATGFWAVALAVLSMAADHGKPGASVKRALVRAASNYDPARHGAADDPTWAIVPR